MKKASWIRPRTPRPGVRLTLECLEDRCLLAAGALDNSFGSIFNPVTNTLTSTQGKVSLQFLGPTDVETANAVAVQQDGKVVAAGNFNFNGEANQFDYAVARFLGNGQLDTTFGNGGKALVSFGPLGGVNERLNGLAIQSDGKIVVGGWALFGADEDFTAARLNTDGTLDTTFGTGGRVRIAQIGGTDNNERGTALTLQTIGGEQRIVLAGIDFFGTSDDFAAARLLPNGTLDVTFNAAGPTPGTINTTFGATDQAFAVTILPGDNSIVLGGQTTTGGGVTPNFALIKYDVNAAAAPALRAFEFAAGAPDQIRGVAAQTIGGADKIVAVGSTAIPAGSFAVARLNADLTDDTTFDTDGRQTVDFGGDDQGQAVVIQPDNKIVVAGFTVAGGLGDFAVARLTTAGALDTSFDTDGKQTVDFNGGNDRANAVALDSRLRIVLAGQTQGAAAGATNDFALARLIGQDQLSTAGVYDPTSGNWFLRNSNSAGPPDIPTFAYGGAGQLAVVGDWDGDGDFTVGVYNRASGTFLLRNSNTPGGPDAGNFAFGPLNGIPVAGDWDGDGKWSIGVFDPATGNWFLRNALAPGLPDAGSFPYGSPNSKPVVGDWNGDGVWTIGVVEPDGTWKLKNVNLAGTPDFSFAYGSPTSLVFAGDWNGDGISTPGVADANGVLTWKIRNSNSAGPADAGVFAYGGGAFLPVAGDWNFPALPLQADRAGAGAAAISTGDLNGTVQAALDRLRAAGVGQSALDGLAQATVELRSLSGATLGLAFTDGNRIVVDDDGAGHGWFVDPTPGQDEEYVGGQALAGSAAAGRMDLLTTVLHEMGHLAGLADNDGSAVMAGVLGAGTRRT